MAHLPIVRSIVREDVDALTFLAGEFEQHLNTLVEGRHRSSRMTHEVFLRDGFSEPPGFHGIILERDNQPLGYLLYCFGYNTDLATRVVQVVDLFIRSEEHGNGFGRLLMRALIPICETAGIYAICVSVWKANLQAKHFMSDWEQNHPMKRCCGGRPKSGDRAYSRKAALT